MAIGAVAAGLSVAVLMTGCGGSDDNAGGSGNGGEPTNGVVTIQAGTQVPQGSPLDKGSEHLTQAQLAQVFVGTAPRMMVMCHANDPLTIAGGLSGGASGDYNIEEVIATGSLQITANADGTLTATASDHISPNGSGLVGKFVDYRIIGGSHPVVPSESARAPAG